MVDTITPALPIHDELTPPTFQPAQDEHDGGIQRSTLSKPTTWVSCLATSSCIASTQSLDALIGPSPLDRVFHAKIFAREKTFCRISGISFARRRAHIFSHDHF